jgi:ATP-binding cassette subfamily C protein/ATP-binding cassette subfamily C protein LapB
MNATVVRNAVARSSSDVERYETEMVARTLGGIADASDLATCLMPLLKALGWKGDPRHALESLPHFANELDITALRNTMATLNYSSRPERVKLRKLDRRLVPCLFLPNGKSAMVIKAIEEDGTIVAFDAATGETGPVKNYESNGTAYFFSALGADAAKPTSWFRNVIDRFRPLYWQAFLVTLLLNVLSISTPLFSMAIYDKVIGASSPDMLRAIALGVSLALLADAALREVRARLLAFIGARIDNIVGNNAFQQILALPPGFTERATIGAQVARLKDFESVREFFTGPLAAVFMELPFAVLYFAVIAIIGGVIAVVPMIAMAIFLIGGRLILPVVRQNVATASRAASKRQEFLVETMGKMRSVKLSSAEKTWLGRYRDMSARAAAGGFKNGLFAAIIAALSNVLVILAGLATITLGVIGIIDGTMTIGALIAAMMLVWRVLSPIQTGFSMIQRVEQTRGSIRQIDGLMALTPERDPKAIVAPLKNIRGRVAFSRVSLRYSGDADPALVGASFEIEPGEVVAITGRNGSGKSTVIKLILGLYHPQAGSIRIDAADIRQIDPIELRHAIAYAPQSCDLFFGTVAQNMRLVVPTASDADLRDALEKAGAWEEIVTLERGINTRLGEGVTEHLPTSLIQKISLARAYLKRAPILLLDEPVNGLDFEGDRDFLRAVEELRGRTTIFMVTHRPSHLKIADKILVFDGGYLRLAGPADEVRPRIPPDIL